MATAIATPVAFIRDSDDVPLAPVMQPVRCFYKDAAYRQHIGELVNRIEELKEESDKADQERKQVKVETVLKVAVAKNKLNKEIYEYIAKFAQLQNVNLNDILTVLGGTCLNQHTALELSRATIRRSEDALRDFQTNEGKTVGQNTGIGAGIGLGVGYFAFGLNTIAGVLKTVGSGVGGGIIGGGVTECIQTQGDAVGIMRRNNETQRQSFRARREILCNTLKGFLLLIFLRNAYMTPELENTFRGLVNMYIGAMLQHIVWERAYPVTDEDGNPKIITSEEIVDYVQGFLD